LKVTRIEQAPKARDNPKWSHPSQALGQSFWINLDTEVNHHQVETKGPRTPLEMPSSRYRTRSFGEERTLSSLIFKMIKDVYNLNGEEYLNPLPTNTLGWLVNTSQKKS